MLAGRPPFTGETAVSVAYQHVSEAVTPPSVFNPELSAALDQVVLHALAKDRNQRFQSAEEFREHLLTASLAPNTVASPVVQTPTEELAEPTFEDLLAEEFFSTPVEEPVVEAPVAEVPTVVAPSIEAPTEAFTPTTDTNPFATIGVEFETINEEADFKPTKTKTSTQKPSPGLLWGMGTGAAVVIVGLVVWLLTFGGGGITNFHPTAGGNAVADVTNMTYADAKAKLATQNLVVSEQFEVSDTVAPDSVIRTDPPAGTKVADGTMITLYVSSGQSQATIPNVAGMTEAEAQLALTNAHLTLGTITEGTSPTVVKGQVISTDPVAGTQVAQNSVVNLLISNGQVMVPDVTGKGLSDAKRILQGPDVNLLVDVSSLQPCTNGAAPLGVIVRQQSIPAGLVDAGSSITIYVDCTQ
jgi:serine/threonine-protein kinase